MHFFFLLAKNLLNVFKNNPLKYFCTICYIFLAHHALLSGKVERLNFTGILIKSAIFAYCGSRRCPARKLNTKFVFPNNKDQLIFIWEPSFLLFSWGKLHFFSFFSSLWMRLNGPLWRRMAVRHNTRKNNNKNITSQICNCLEIFKIL